MKEKKLAGLSPFERFESLAKALVAVPKEEVLNLESKRPSKKIKVQSRAAKQGREK